MFLPRPRIKLSIVGSLRDRKVACSALDRQGSNFEFSVWRAVSSHSSHHPQEVLLAQFSLYVHKGGLKPDSFHLRQNLTSTDVIDVYRRQILTYKDCPCAERVQIIIMFLHPNSMLRTIYNKSYGGILIILSLRVWLQLVCRCLVHAQGTLFSRATLHSGGNA